VRILSLSVALAWLAGAALTPASAEPYLAVQQGLQCSACHVHPAGGGKRNAYGNAYAQTEMPTRRVGDSELWTGEVSKWLGIGGNVRADYRYVDTPNQQEVSEFDVSRATIYIEAQLVPQRLSFYIDQQLAPGGSLNREAYVKLRGASGKWHVAAGQFFLPYGLRLQDDSAFVRETSGVNFNNPDRGVQAGYESGPWSGIVSLTNGSGGASENDTGKQASFVGSYVRSAWRVGLSLNVNNSDAGDRRMANLFFGLRTGPIAWLAEVDQIVDDLPAGGERDALAGLVEADWLIGRGNNLKFAWEYFDPDNDLSEDQQVRWSVVWEHTPMQFVQARIGLRAHDGIPQVDAQNRTEAFVELHGFF